MSSPPLSLSLPISVTFFFIRVNILISGVSKNYPPFFRDSGTGSKTDGNEMTRRITMISYTGAAMKDNISMLVVSGK